VERIYIPLLKKLRINYEWDKQSKTLKFYNGLIDFRSADNPENWEGYKYKIVLLNEAGIILKNDYLWENAVKPMMLDYPDSVAIIGGTPKGKRTKKGKHKFFDLYEHSFVNPERYFVKQLSSYDNLFIKKEEIDEYVKETASTVVRQEIYGEFIDNEDCLLKSEFIQQVDTLPLNLDYFVGVDLAISQKTTADYTSIVVAGINRDRIVYVVDVIRFRGTFNEILDRIKAVNELYKPKRIYIESVQAQAYVVHELARTTNLPIKAIKPDTDKVTRFYSVLAKYEQGLVYHYSKMKQIREFEDELISFPEGEHDDMVDALVYAIQGTNKMMY
jgi:predicted phage terminase large subunit-like protein